MDAAVDIRPTYAALGFASEAAPIRCTAGGAGPFDLTWKETLRIPVAPGPVVVVVWSSWITKKFMGTSYATLDVPAGSVVGLEWKMPGSVFTAGKMKVVDDLAPPIGLARPIVAEGPPDAGPQRVAPPHGSRPLAQVPLVARQGPPVAPPAGQWAPDPAGRWPQRWWDGTRWTEHVSDGTRSAVDPVPDP